MKDDFEKWIAWQAAWNARADLVHVTDQAKFSDEDKAVPAYNQTIEGSVCAIGSIFFTGSLTDPLAECQAAREEQARLLLMAAERELILCGLIELLGESLQKVGENRRVWDKGWWRGVKALYAYRLYKEKL